MINTSRCFTCLSCGPLRPRIRCRRLGHRPSWIPVQHRKPRGRNRD